MQGNQERGLLEMKDGLDGLDRAKQASGVMQLRVVGAGLPRTGTSSLKVALERLLGGRCYHMSAIPGHPFELGAGWDNVLAGGTPDWDQLFEGYVAAVDWPASLFLARTECGESRCAGAALRA